MLMSEATRVDGAEQWQHGGDGKQMTEDDRSLAQQELVLTGSKVIYVLKYF